MLQLYFFRRPLLWVLTAYCLLLALLKLTGTLDRIPANDPARWADERCAVTGIVASHPDPRPTGCVYILSAEIIEPFEDFERYSSQGSILVQIMQSTAAAAEPGDRLRVSGRLQRPRSALIPGEFDYQEYLSHQNIHALMYSGPYSVENLGPTGRVRFARWSWKIKGWTSEIFSRYLSEEQAAVLSGLTVGNRPRFNPDIKQIFVESGTMHVLVASGSNVAFVIVLWILFTRLIRLQRRWALFSTLGPIWIYVLVAGADAPIVRAGLMGTIAIVTRLAAREDRPYQALAFAALVILMAAPRSLFDVGFQMSFLTVFGLIYFLSPLEEVMRETPFWMRWPGRLLAASLTAQIWLLPVSINTFGRIFPLSVLSNILVVPWAGLGLTAGLMLTAAEAAGKIFLTPAIFFCQMYAQSLITLVRFCAAHLGWSLWLAPLPPVSIIGFYAGCLALPDIKQFRPARWIFGGAIILLASGLLLDRKAPISSLTVTWIDTGRRLSTLIQTAEGKNILINPGPKEPFDSTERTLMPLFTRAGVRRLDAVLITQSRPEWTSGLESLQKWVQVDSVTTPGPMLMWMNAGNKKILMADALTLKMQDYLLAHPIGKVAVIQSHFPQKWLWRPEFIRRYKPELIVETLAVTSNRPSVPPWNDVPLVIPQKLGWYRWKDEL